jgi:hypothetical protein
LKITENHWGMIEKSLKMWRSLGAVIATPQNLRSPGAVISTPQMWLFFSFINHWKIIDYHWYKSLEIITENHRKIIENHKSLKIIENHWGMIEKSLKIWRSLGAVIATPQNLRSPGAVISTPQMWLFFSFINHRKIIDYHWYKSLEIITENHRKIIENHKSLKIIENHWKIIEKSLKICSSLNAVIATPIFFMISWCCDCHSTEVTHFFIDKPLKNHWKSLI